MASSYAPRNLNSDQSARDSVDRFLRSMQVPEGKFSEYRNMIAHGEGAESHWFRSNAPINLDILNKVSDKLNNSKAGGNNSNDMLNTILKETESDSGQREAILKRVSALHLGLLKEQPHESVRPDDPNLQRNMDMAYGADRALGDKPTGYDPNNPAKSFIEDAHDVNSQYPASEGYYKELSGRRKAYYQKHTAAEANDPITRQAVEDVAWAITPRTKDPKADAATHNKNKEALLKLNAAALVHLQRELTSTMAGAGIYGDKARRDALKDGEQFRGVLVQNESGKLDTGEESKERLEKAMEPIQKQLADISAGKAQPPAATPAPTPPAAKPPQAPKQKADGKPALTPDQLAERQESMGLFMDQLGITDPKKREAFAKRHEGADTEFIHSFEENLRSHNQEGTHGKTRLSREASLAGVLGNGAKLITPADLTEKQIRGVHTSLDQTGTEGSKRLREILETERKLQGKDPAGPWAEGFLGPDRQGIKWGEEGTPSRTTLAEKSESPPPAPSSVQRTTNNPPTVVQASTSAPPLVASPPPAQAPQDLGFFSSWGNQNSGENFMMVAANSPARRQNSAPSLRTETTPPAPVTETTPPAKNTRVAAVGRGLPGQHHQQQKARGTTLGDFLGLRGGSEPG